MMRLLFTLILSTQVNWCLSKLLVISLDGFRNSYLERFEVPNLARLRQGGARAMNGIQSSFTTMTFPCHWTLATGLNEESHGLVSNNFYDRDRHVKFFKNTSDGNFFGGEAIWTTAKRAGRKVSVIMWPGCSIKRHPYDPDHVVSYNESVPLQYRVSLALESTKSHDLTMLYWHQPDQVGHQYGPDSENLAPQFQEINQELGPIADRLSDPENDLNVLVVSDHGMAAVTKVATLNFGQVLDEMLPIVKQNGINATAFEQIRNETTVSATPILTHFYFPETPFNAEGTAFFFRWQLSRDKGIDGLPTVEDALNAMKTGTIPSSSEPVKIDGFTYYLKRELPNRWFYRHHHHIGDLVAVGDEGAALSIIKEKDKYIYKVRETTRGAHGYDNTLESMRGIFIASGPAFKSGHQLNEIIPQTSIYPLMCHLLQIEPAANNGSLSHFKSALTEAASAPSAASPLSRHTFPFLSLSMIFLAPFFN